MDYFISSNYDNVLLGYLTAKGVVDAIILISCSLTYGTAIAGIGNYHRTIERIFTKMLAVTQPTLPHGAYINMD